MSSYEQEIEKKLANKEALPETLDIPTLKYFWQANPLVRNKQTIPKFLRKVQVLSNFTDYELMILSRFMHYRNFAKDECVFKEGDIGVGFYLILSGTVRICTACDDGGSNLVVSLDRNEYFGELAILQEKGVRNASAIAGEQSELLGIFKPDLEKMIHSHPIIATKFLHSISIITANRFYNVTSEIKRLKQKVALLEEELNARKKD